MCIRDRLCYRCGRFEGASGGDEDFIEHVTKDPLTILEMIEDDILIPVKLSISTLQKVFMFEMIDELFSEIVIAIALGSGGTLIAYFRKISLTQKDLCNRVTQLQKALIILATALDRQSNRLHEEADSDMEDLVGKVLDDK